MKRKYFCKGKDRNLEGKGFNWEKKKMNFSLIPSDVLKIPVVHTLDTEVY